MKKKKKKKILSLFTASNNRGPCFLNGLSVFLNFRCLRVVATALRFAIRIPTLLGQREFVPKRRNEIFAGRREQPDECLFRLWEEVQVEGQFVEASEG